MTTVSDALAFRKQRCENTPCCARCPGLLRGGPLAMVAPKARTPLSADALVPVVRRGCAPSPEPRAEAVDLACTATLLAACALFSLHAPSLPAFDKERTEGHGHTLDGLQPVPGDPSRRERLEPVSPTVLRPVCQSVVRQRQRGKALDARPCLDGEQGDAGDYGATPVQWSGSFTCHSNPEKLPYACQTSARHGQR